jgi:hypothetical protein
MRFWSFLHVSQHEEIADRGIDYIVFHKDLASEVPNFAERAHITMTHWIAEYRSLYGGSYFEDSSIVVFSTNDRTGFGQSGYVSSLRQ